MLGSDVKWKRNDWIKYWSTSNVWPGNFGSIPQSEAVPLTRLPRMEQLEIKQQRKLPVDKHGDNEGDDEDEGDADDEEDEEMQAASAVHTKANERFRPEQVPVRFLVDMLLIYGRAWKDAPKLPGTNGVPGTNGEVVVVDPFCGSSSAAMAAQLLDCQFIGLDNDRNAQIAFHGYGNMKKEQQGTYQKMLVEPKLQKVYARALSRQLLPTVTNCIYIHLQGGALLDLYHTAPESDE